MSLYKSREQKGDENMGLLSYIASAIENGDYDNEEDYCNQNGCNYEDIYSDD